MSSLDGIKVIDLSRLLPGPYCSMVLADHGADVIAIEDRRFQSDDLFFDNVNRNKRHMTLNLKSDSGKKIFFQLTEEADVILEGFRPGVVKRLGVDYDAVRKINPSIIYCAITGYGQDGELCNCPGHDVNYMSRAGVLDLIGEKGRPPVIPAVQFADIAGGAMNAVIGILLALHERQKSGIGQYIDISMTDGMVGFLTLPHYLLKAKKEPQKRSETMLSHGFACYNTYETADGKFLAIGAVENRFWRNLCNILGLEHYSDLQYDRENKEKIIADLRTIFRKNTLSHWEAELAGKDVCFSKVHNIEEVLSDPLFRQRQMVVNIGENEEKAFGVAVKLSRTPGTIRTAPQRFGQATVEILKELGYSNEAIEYFFEEGVV